MDYSLVFLQRFHFMSAGMREARSIPVILFWNIPSTSMLPSWLARMVDYSLQDMNLISAFLFKALTICVKSQTFCYYGTLNLDWIMYIVHVSYPWASLFSDVLWEICCLKPASKRPLIRIKPAPSGFYPSCKSTAAQFLVYLKGDITSVEQI
jgi:hypothetical protein